MKLKNKISGEIKEFALFDGNELQGGATLESLTKEWEDYKEKQLGYWYYDTTVNRVDFIDASNVSDEDKKLDQQIGNYFETKEDAEKVIKKLKAWKRLKDKGFRFDGWDVKTAGSEGDRLLINLYVKDCTECESLLDFLFGGEK